MRGTASELRLKEVRTLYEGEQPPVQPEQVRDERWRLVAAAASQVTGTSVLEVGVGAGRCFNILARDESIERLVGVETDPDDRLIPPDRGELQRGSILHLDVPDKTFDTVICTDALARVSVIDFPKALSELRRVCRGTLIILVPTTASAECSSNTKMQTFSTEKLDRFFPRGTRRVFCEAGLSHVMICESFKAGPRRMPARAETGDSPRKSNESSDTVGTLGA